jgi:hypothetical protein
MGVEQVPRFQELSPDRGATAVLASRGHDADLRVGVEKAR